MIPAIPWEPNILIVSGKNKYISKKIGKSYAQSGASVTIADMSTPDHRVIIKNLNKQGVEYASLTREICNDSDEEACDVLFFYLNNWSQYDLVINLAGDNETVIDKLTDILNPNGGIVYTQNKLDVQIYTDI